MLLFVRDKEFELAEFKIASSKCLRKAGQTQGSKVQLYHIYPCIICIFSIKISIKIAVCIIHRFYCLSSRS